MIKYALKCEVEHGFEAWFSSSDSFDEQAAKGLVECPMCGSTHVTKAIMAPMVRTSKEETPPADMRQVVAEVLHKLRKHVEDTHTYVGGAFASEARDMHQGLTPERPIYGEATTEEVKALVEEGVPVAPLPIPVEAKTAAVQKKLN
jgi:hypothetical protein